MQCPIFAEPTPAMLQSFFPFGGGISREFASSQAKESD